VISRFVNGFDSFRRSGALVLFVLATLAQGCGWSQHTEASSGTGVMAGPDKLLKAEDLYRYEGQGKAKRKVALGRRERRQLLQKVSKKAE
jgi:hypothetical protein